KSFFADLDRPWNVQFNVSHNKIQGGEPFTRSIRWQGFSREGLNSLDRRGVRIFTLTPMQTKTTLAGFLAVTSLLALPLASIRAAEPGFKSLFNGTDLTGWEGKPKLWSVRDGAITGVTGSDPDTKIGHNTFLVWTNGPVDDFELRVTYRIEKGNSGIQSRSEVN